MAKLIDKKVEILTQSSFKEYLVWCWDETNEFRCPVQLDDHTLPNDLGDLFIRAVLSTSSGVTFDGYIIGPHSVFGFGLFHEGKKYQFNLNAPSFVLKEQRRLAEAVGYDIELFPLKYETDFVRLDGQPVGGVIELKPGTPI